MCLDLLPRRELIVDEGGPNLTDVRGAERVGGGRRHREVSVCSHPNESEFPEDPWQAAGVLQIRSALGQELSEGTVQVVSSVMLWQRGVDTAEGHDAVKVLDHQPATSAERSDHPVEGLTAASKSDRQMMPLGVSLQVEARTQK